METTVNPITILAPLSWGGGFYFFIASSTGVATPDTATALPIWEDLVAC